jgi:inosose dehydratase
VNPLIVAQVLDKDLPFAEAVRMGAMVEPPLGVPEMGPLLDAVSALDRDVDAIIEHDLYPCAPDVPLPIAKRTKAYLSTCSEATINFGRPHD